MRLVLVLILLAGGAFLWLTSGRSGGIKMKNEEEALEVTGRPDTYLTAQQRQDLFDLERADLLLGRALKPFLKAVREGDEAGIRACLDTDFQGTVPDLAAAPVHADVGGSYGIESLTKTTAVDADGFVQWLAALRGQVHHVDAVKLGRKKNGIEIIGPADATAESSGVFRFAGRRQGGGRLEIMGRFALSHAGLKDYDGQGPLKAWMRGIEFSALHRVRSAAPLFEEITEASGIDTSTMRDNWVHNDGINWVMTGGVYLGDVNADGALDLIVTEREKRSWLYLGLGTGAFRDTGWNPPIPKMDLIHVAIFDATGDGRVNVLHAGRLYAWNDAKETLVPVPGASVLPNADPSLCDYDRDGLTDIYMRYAGAQAPGRSARAFFDDDRVTGRENLLHRSLGGGRFEDVTTIAKASGGFGRTFASAWFYANDDPWPDLFCANEFGRNAYLINKGDGTFEDMPDIDPQFGGFSMGLSTGDLNGDGRTDLYVSNMYSKAGHRIYHHLDLNLYPQNVRNMFMASVTGNRMYLRQGDGTRYDEVSIPAGVNAVGWGWSGAVADFNLDGWLDIYAPCGHTSADATKPDG